MIISSKMLVNSSITIIKNFFNITYVKNIGAAFSILSGSRILLIMIALIAIYIIYKLLVKNKNLNKINIINYSLLIGGIIGNLIDRIIRGYVVDYLDFTIFNYNFPIFNIADICIVISCILLIFTIKEE